MQDFDYILLLNKRFAGEITTQESSVLDAWINQSAENAELAKQYQAVWENSLERQYTFSVDLDAEFQRLQTRIKSDQSASTRVVPIGRWLLRAAAVIGVLALSIWGYRQFMGTQTEYVVEFVQNESKRAVKLPDGSMVWLRENARLEYPKIFEKDARRIKLEGEAYFDVEPYEACPFQIDLPSQGWVQVLGTKFNVLATPDSTTVLVREGRVRYKPLGVDHDQGVELTPGLKAKFFPEEAQLKLTKVNTFNELAWQTGGLEFVQTPLKYVLKDLEQYYKVEIDLYNHAMGDCLYTAPVTNQPIDEVLKGLALVYRFKIHQTRPGVYLLSYGICQ